MSEDNIENNNNNEDKKPESKSPDISGILAKNQELLKETKEAKDEVRNLRERLSQLESSKKEQSQDDDNYKNLYEAEKKRAAELQQEVKDRDMAIRNTNLDTVSSEMANELAKGKPESAKLLKTFVRQSLEEYASDNGQVSNDIMESVKYTFQNDPTYAPLIGVSKASGGGATGSDATKQMKKFSEMSEAERTALWKSSPEKFRELREQQFGKQH